MSTHLLIIDPQIDFCCPVRGALFVPGAERDMQRLAQMIHRNRAAVDAIHVTLDTHHNVHIAHPIFWTDANGKSPEPFTRISVADVQEGKWTARKPELRERALRYVQSLETGGRYVLTIWPPHCLIGSEGHAVKPALFDALCAWEAQYRQADFIPKGANVLTEHYSAIRAEVADPSDATTQTNTSLVETLRRADRVLIAGEAGSHCVASTVRDLVELLGEDRRKLVLLTDAMSAVPGFEHLQTQFLTDMGRLGVPVADTQSAL